MVGDMERTRLKQVKVLFFLGVNDGNIPKNASKGGIISDMGREFLIESGTEMAPSPRQQMYIQRLYLYLNMNAGIGELMRTTSFKDKARQQLHIDRVNTTEGDVEKEIFNEGNKHSVSAGLLTYPTLMAADIIIHKAVKVPVGKDQETNNGMARVLPVVSMQLTESNVSRNPPLSIIPIRRSKVPGLDGSGKMGKSEGNAIYLIDDEKTIKKKVMKAVTDAGPTEPNSVKPEPNSPICLR